MNNTAALMELGFRLATTEDSHLPTYDYTKLSAYNTCPTYGVIRYAHHKKFETHSRAMALEAGYVMHEVFQFVRLVTLAQQLDGLDKDGEFINAMMNFHGDRLFGSTRWDLICENSPNTEDVITRTKNDVINVLETSGFYDDGYDKRRTLTNLEEAALFYVDKWNWEPLVWMRDYDNPCSDVGIEIPFDIVVEINKTPKFRFTGKIDGIREHRDGWSVEDNKTASRLNEAWEMSFETSHQLTGYCVASRIFTGHDVRNAEAIGLAIPMPRAEYSGFVRAPVRRTDDQFAQWVKWLIYSVAGYTDHYDTPLDAPMFTHSCNRYFRPCAYIPFCVGSRKERQEMFDEMMIEEWSPLHRIEQTEGE